MTWTVEEARAYLPRLRGLLSTLRRATSGAIAVHSNGHAAGVAEGLRARGGGRSEINARGAVGTEAAYSGPISAKAALRELEANSIVLRDLRTGLLDFPSVTERGTDVELCWRSDEDDLGWWHLPGEGFAGRKPLPIPPGA